MKKIRQDIVENQKTAVEEYASLTNSQKQQLRWFQDQKIGVIFHWGLYSAAGIVESWQLSKEDTWARKKPWRKDLTTLRHDYWNLAKAFNPAKFDPEKWATEIQKAGFRYAIFTTKHHDGFNMYATQQSDFNVTHYTGKDLFHEFAKSLTAHNVAVGAYYSKADWHCPYYWTPGSDPRGRYASYDPLSNPQLWKKFNNFVKKQLLEITRNCGKIDILWLDGGWVNSEHHEFLDMDRIVSQIKQTQPQILVVDRTIGGKYEDYVTPERKIPDVIPHKVWESNLPLAKNWGYVPNDVYKTFPEILHYLVKIVSLGGNVILGIGPKPDGTLPTPALKLIRQLGKWLATYGDGIYGTRALPNLKQTNWYFTAKDHFLYAFAEKKYFRPQDLQLGIFTPHVLNRQDLSMQNPDDPILGLKITMDKNVTELI